MYYVVIWNYDNWSNWYYSYFGTNETAAIWNFETEVLNCFQYGADDVTAIMLVGLKSLKDDEIELLINKLNNCNNQVFIHDFTRTEANKVEQLFQNGDEIYYDGPADYYWEIFNQVQNGRLELPLTPKKLSKIFNLNNIDLLETIDYNDLNNDLQERLNEED